MADYKAGLHLIPEHMHGAVGRYIEQGIPGGSFLTAILANDFLNAFGRADSTNQRYMTGWAEFIYNHLPIDSHGSYEIVEAWKGLNNVEEGLHSDS